jgi:hypothetical protein
MSTNHKPYLVFPKISGRHNHLMADEPQSQSRPATEPQPSSGCSPDNIKGNRRLAAQAEKPAIARRSYSLFSAERSRVALPVGTD